MRIGTDVVAVARIAAVATRRPAFLTRVFTDREIADAHRNGAQPGTAVVWNRLAGRFAAKEAARKALGWPRRWRGIEVRTTADGAPTIWVDGVEATGLAVSIAHDGGVAVATVLATTTDQPPGDRPRRNRTRSEP